MDDPPKARIRLAWWFGIYFAAQLPLLFLLPWKPWFPLVFPIGIGLPIQIGEPIAYVYDIWYPNRFIVFCLCYLFFIAHLAFTYYVPTLRAFKRTIVGLVMIVLFTLGGSYYELSTNSLFDLFYWVGEPLNATDALALLSPSKHVSNPSGFVVPVGSYSQRDYLIAQQLLAIKYIGDHKVREGISNLIMYINYPSTLPLPDLAHGADLENVKNCWTAFGALVDMPESAPILRDYCLNEKNPIGYRIAALHALKYIDNDSFHQCVQILRDSQKQPKVQAYLNYLETDQAQYMGIPDLP